MDLLKNNKLRHHGWIPQSQWVCDNKKIQVDHVLQFENLNKDLCKMLDSLSIPYDKDLPLLNHSHAGDIECSTHAIDIIKNIYLADFEIFNYD